MSPELQSRWKSNLAAAGIEVDEETVRRVEPSVSERLDGLREALGRLDYQDENPDYLRDSADEEHASGDA